MSRWWSVQWNISWKMKTLWWCFARVGNRNIWWKNYAEQSGKHWIIPLLALNIFDCNIHKHVIALKVMGEECSLEKQTWTWRKKVLLLFLRESFCMLKINELCCRLIKLFLQHWHETIIVLLKWTSLGFKVLGVSHFLRLFREFHSSYFGKETWEKCSYVGLA